ncbi:MAG: hypothetical protein H7144_17540 [Burkholderiales bacterium]|nr:hypothetical protein [Phycisphaerae bacterium]
MAAEEELGILQIIRELRSRTPFNPFRIVMGSGESHVVENSELLAIGQSQLIYCKPHSDRVVYLRLNQISEVEDLGDKRVAS